MLFACQSDRNLQAYFWATPYMPQIDVSLAVFHEKFLADGVFLQSTHAVSIDEAYRQNSPRTTKVYYFYFTVNIVT